MHPAEEVFEALRAIEKLECQGLTRSQACKQLSISEQQVLQWRLKYGHLTAQEVSRLVALDEGVARLKRTFAQEDSPAPERIRDSPERA